MSFLLKDAANTAKYIQLNSKENNQNRPQLLISTSSANTPLVSNTADLSKEILSSSLSKTRVYPNPVLNKLNIELSNNYKGFVYVKIVDPEGRIYDLGKMKPTPGAALLEIDISRMSLSKGIYFLHLNTEAKEAEIIKFVIQ